MANQSVRFVLKVAITFCNIVARFDIASFYPEANRILKPTGCFAAWGYDLLTFPDRQAAQSVLQKLFSVTLAQYWNPRLAHVKNHYKGESVDI